MGLDSSQTNVFTNLKPVWAKLKFMNFFNQGILIYNQNEGN
jgi:hypothetical protein